MAVIRELSIKTSLGDGVLSIEHVALFDALSEPFTIEIDLLSSNPDLDISSLVGDVVTVSIDLEEGKSRYLNGFVTHMTLSGTYDQFARYHVTVRPWLFMLSSKTDSRIFQNMTVPAIVESVFREHGFSDFKESFSGSYKPSEFIVQYQESDFAFVSRLMERAGIYYYFQHTDESHTLILADSIMAHGTVPGYEQVAFHPEGAPSPTGVEFVNDLKVVHRWQSGAYGGTDYDFTRPRLNLMVTQPAEVRHRLGNGQVFEFPSGHLVRDEAQAYVKARLEAIQQNVEVIHGSGNVRGLGAGNLFKLTAYPTDARNTDYLIVSASLDASNNPAESGGSEGSAECHLSFTAIEKTVPYRPALATPRPRVQGPQTARVVGPSGEEIMTDKYGRVKVHFEWDRDDLGEKSSCWVRVAQLWAGSGWGGVHIPRVGQEVIVDFLEGDPDRPIITGRVYNADNMPPYALPDNKTQSGIKSHSTLGGGPSNFNEIRFEDKKGSEELHVQAEKDQSTLVKNNQSLSVGAARTKSVGADEKSDITGNRTETVGKDEKITVTGNRTESVGQNETITIGVNRTLSVGAAESISIGSTQTEAVAAAKTVMVGGAYSIAVGAASSEVVAGAKTIGVGAASSEMVAASKSVTAGGDIGESAGGAVNLEAGGAFTATAGKDATIKSAANLVGHADKKVTLDAGDELTLSCGSASIVLKKGGDIIINGAKISITGSGDVVIKGSKIAQN